MYAIWYLFEKNDEEEIKKNIIKISKQYKTPVFLPHITAYGLIKTDLEIIERSVLESIKNIKPFTVKKKSISISNNFWKTLFIKFENNSNMLQINKKLTENFLKFSKYTFEPHASLIYKNMNFEEKQNIIEHLELKDNFKINSIGILKFSESISKWKIIKKEYLDKF